jgi:hypothetical protein
MISFCWQIKLDSFYEQEINKNVYQAPLDVQEVTKVDLENWIT